MIPPKNDIFPHLDGNIIGFGAKYPSFQQYQEHHIQDKERQKEYDITAYSIVKFFNLCMENNPNIIDALFVPRRCVLYTTNIGEHIRSNRHIFLHKGGWHKFRGYSYAQMSKIDGKQNSSNTKRKADIEKYGYDVKFGMHVVRLLLEIEEIMSTGTLTLDKNSEILKSIRRGEWTLDRLKEWHQEKEKSLEHIFAESKLPHSPDENKIKKLLLECLECHYGSLTEAVRIDKNIENLVNDLQTVLDKYKIT